MAFVRSDLSVIAYANGHTQWHYTTTNTAAQVAAANYFNSASDMVRAGDFIFANTASAKAQIYVITGNTNGVVTIAQMAANP